MKTLDITPSWQEVLPLLLRAARGDRKRNKEAVDAAVTELMRMAEAADKWNEYVKSKNPKPKGSPGRKKKVLLPVEQNKVNFLYHSNERSIEAISRILGVSPPIIVRHLFPTRDKWEAWVREQVESGAL